MQVMQHDPARLKPFDEVKATLAAEYKKQRVNDIMQQISDKAQAMLQKDPMHPEKVASDLNMQLVRVDGYENGKPIPEIGVSAEFDQSIAGLKKGEVSQPVALAANKIALAVALDVTPARPSTFAESESAVREEIIRKRSSTAVQNHAKELLDKAKSMGGDLAKAAKSMGLEVKTSDDISRERRGGRARVRHLRAGRFQAAGRIGLRAGGDARFDDRGESDFARRTPDMSKLAEQRTTIRDELKGQKGRDREALFESSLREALIKQGKIKIHQDVINRLITQYRGA